MQREIEFLEAQRRFLQLKAEVAAKQHSEASEETAEAQRQNAHEKQMLEEVTAQKLLLSGLYAQQQQSLQQLKSLINESPMQNYVSIPVTMSRKSLVLTRVARFGSA